MKPAQKNVTGKVIPRAPHTADVQAYVPELLKGMALTMRHFFRTPRRSCLAKSRTCARGSTRGRHDDLLSRGASARTRSGFAACTG